MAEEKMQDQEEQKLEEEIGVTELDNEDLEDVSGGDNGICGFGCAAQ